MSKLQRINGNPKQRIYLYLILAVVGIFGLVGLIKFVLIGEKNGDFTAKTTRPGIVASSEDQTREMVRDQVVQWNKYLEWVAIREHHNAWDFQEERGMPNPTIARADEDRRLKTFDANMIQIERKYQDVYKPLNIADKERMAKFTESIELIRSQVASASKAHVTSYKTERKKVERTSFAEVEQLQKRHMLHSLEDAMKVAAKYQQALPD